MSEHYTLRGTITRHNGKHIVKEDQFEMDLDEAIFYLGSKYAGKSKRYAGTEFDAAMGAWTRHIERKEREVHAFRAKQL